MRSHEQTAIVGIIAARNRQGPKRPRGASRPIAVVGPETTTVGPRAAPTLPADCRGRGGYPRGPMARSMPMQWPRSRGHEDGSGRHPREASGRRHLPEDWIFTGLAPSRVMTAYTRPKRGGEADSFRALSEIRSTLLGRPRTLAGVKRVSQISRRRVSTGLLCGPSGRHTESDRQRRKRGYRGSSRRSGPADDGGRPRRPDCTTSGQFREPYSKQGGTRARRSKASTRTVAKSRPSRAPSRAGFPLPAAKVGLADISRAPLMCQSLVRNPARSSAPCSRLLRRAWQAPRQGRHQRAARARGAEAEFAAAQQDASNRISSTSRRGSARSARA